MKNKTILSFVTAFFMTALFFSCAMEPTAPTADGDKGTTEKTKYTFSVEAVSNNDGSGSIVDTSTTNGTYESGTSITVHANAAQNNTFVGWYDASIDGNLISKSIKHTFPLNKNSQLFAIFIHNQLLVEFADPVLEEAVRAEISKPDGYLTTRDVVRITSLQHVGIKNKISSLQGIEKLRYLNQLRIQNNKITDLKPLESLNSLEFLVLNDNQGLEDISVLKNKKSLKSVFIAGNRIKDISALAELTSLKYVSLEVSLVSDITPLLNNIGIGTGDEVVLSQGRIPNSQIERLKAKGVKVTVSHDKM